MPLLAAVPTGSETSPCCCSDCCMYPASALEAEDYLDEDLPDSLDVSGVPMSRSGTSYGDTTDGVILESGVWAVYVGGVRTTQECLIGGMVEDDFPDILTASVSLSSGYFNESIALTRVSDCCWENLDVTLSTEGEDPLTRSGVVRVCYDTYATEERGNLEWATVFIEDGDVVAMGFKGLNSELDGYEVDPNVRSNTPLTTEGIEDEVYGNTGDTIFAFVS